LCKPKEPATAQPLTPTENSDSLLESTEYSEQGWLDCNPEAKMHLSNLDNEECISDDEVEVRLFYYVVRGLLNLYGF